MPSRVGSRCDRCPHCSADWILTSKGWVGWIPVSGELTLELKPRVPLASLFAMLEYAYRLNGFYIIPGIVDSDSIRELYEKLASFWPAACSIVPAAVCIGPTSRSVMHSRIFGAA